MFLAKTRFSPLSTNHQLARQSDDADYIEFFFPLTSHFCSPFSKIVPRLFSSHPLIHPMEIKLKARIGNNDVAERYFCQQTLVSQVRDPGGLAYVTLPRTFTMTSLEVTLL